MEARTVETLINDIKNLIGSANFSKSITNQLKTKLAEFEKDERLICPQSNEFFTTDNPAYTILTGDKIQSVVSLTSMNELETYFKTKNLERLDPWTRYKILGYEPNAEIMELVKKTENKLEFMEKLIREEIALPTELEEFNIQFFLLEEQEKQEKAAAENYYRSSDLYSSFLLKDKEEQEKTDAIALQFSLFSPLKNEQEKKKEIEEKYARYINNNTLNLSNKYVSNKEVYDSIVPFLEKHREITILNLQNNDLRGPGAIRALTKIRTLKSLNLSGSQIGDEEVKILAENTTLRELNVSRCEIRNDEGIIALSKNKTLMSLDVSYNYINIEGIEALAENTTLKSLKLAGCALSLNEVKLLAGNTTLETLDLSNNKIKEAGAKVLAVNKTLTTLILHLCEINKNGVEALAQNTTLRSLDLGANSVSSEGALALAKNTTLRILNLSGASIGGFSGATVQAFAGNKTLRSLDISCTNLYSGTYAKVAKILAQNTTLISLNISGNKIGDEGAIALAKNTTLKDLYICGDLRPTEIGVAGIHALAKNKTLLLLDLDGNNIDYAGNKLFVGVPVSVKTYVKCPGNERNEDCDIHTYLDYREVDKLSPEEINRIRKAAGLTLEKNVPQQIAIGIENNLLVEPTKEDVAPRKPCTP
jgi:hypothetical protein